MVEEVDLQTCVESSTSLVRGGSWLGKKIVALGRTNTQSQMAGCRCRKPAVMGLVDLDVRMLERVFSVRLKTRSCRKNGRSCRSKLMNSKNLMSRPGETRYRMRKPAVAVAMPVKVVYSHTVVAERRDDYSMVLPLLPGLRLAIMMGAPAYRLERYVRIASRIARQWKRLNEGLRE